MYVSPISKIAPIITQHSDPRLLVPPQGLSMGYLPRDYSRHPRGCIGGALSLQPIPKSEWKGLVEFKETSQSTLLHKIRQEGITCKMQGRTNYCWMNTVVYAIEIGRAKQGLPYIPLSPASCAAKIKGFSNSGGWCPEGMQYAQKHGVVPVELWPANAIDRQYDKPESWEVAKGFMAWNWEELTPGDTEEIVTCLLMDQPVSIGLNWWGHAITAICLVILPNGDFGIGCINSWGADYGDQGFFVLSLGKGTGDDQSVLIGANASVERMYPHYSIAI